MNNARLITMSGPSSARLSNLSAVKKMSDFEAGIAFMGMIGKMFPGITVSQMINLPKSQLTGANVSGLAGWWTDLKHATGDVTDSIGGILSDSVGMVGGILGSSVRLAADPKVLSAASQAAAAYATGGASAAASGSLQSILGGTSTSDGGFDFSKFIVALGSNFKNMVGGSDAGGGVQSGAVGGMPSGKVLLIGGGIAATVVVILYVATRGSGNKKK